MFMFPLKNLARKELKGDPYFNKELIIFHYPWK